MLDMSKAKTEAYKNIADRETAVNNIINGLKTTMSYINDPVDKILKTKNNNAVIKQKSLQIANKLNNPTLDIQPSKQQNGGWLNKFN